MPAYSKNNSRRRKATNNNYKKQINLPTARQVSNLKFERLSAISIQLPEILLCPARMHSYRKENGAADVVLFSKYF
jgi:hypothetical protein